MMVLVPILSGAVCLRDEQVLFPLIHTRNKAQAWPRPLGTAINSERTEGKGRLGQPVKVEKVLFCFD